MSLLIAINSDNNGFVIIIMLSMKAASLLNMLKIMRFLPLSLNRPIFITSNGKNKPRYTSDAQTSNDSIRLSQYQWQPANIWFKNTTLLHPNDEQDIERQASTDEEENVKEKGQQ